MARKILSPPESDVAVQEEAPETGDSTPRSAGVSPKVIVLLVVLAVFGGMVAAKMMAPSPKAGVGAQQPGGVLTSVRNDAAADYDAAAKKGKPIYVLFHSST